MGEEGCCFVCSLEAAGSIHLWKRSCAADAVPLLPVNIGCVRQVEKVQEISFRSITEMLLEIPHMDRQLHGCMV